MARDLSRRQFFRLRPGDLFKGIIPPRKDDGKEEEVRPIRPPGALPDEIAFLARCEKCTDCASACPHDVILRMGPAFGQGEGSPYLEPGESACHWCESWDCIRACPSGALTLDAGHEPAPIAKVELNRDLCLISQGVLCDTCTHYCPPSSGALTMKLTSLVYNEEQCVGCGLCVYHCEATPTAFKIVPLED